MTQLRRWTSRHLIFPPPSPVSYPGWQNKVVVLAREKGWFFILKRATVMIQSDPTLTSICCLSSSAYVIFVFWRRVETSKLVSE
jgi:hypothetical protein